MTVLLDKDRKEGKELVEMLETLPDSEKKQAAIYIGALYDRQLLAEGKMDDGGKGHKGPGAPREI